MRKKCITGVGCVLFILCGLLIFCSLSNVLRRKTAGETDQIHSFLQRGKERWMYFFFLAAVIFIMGYSQMCSGRNMGLLLM